MKGEKYDLDKDLIEHYVNSGKTLQEYAECELNIKFDSFRRRIKRELGEEFYNSILESNRVNRVYSKIQKQIKENGMDLDRECSKGKSYQQLAKEFSISAVTIKKYVIKFRPDLHEIFINNGIKNHSTNSKLSKKDLFIINSMSKRGIGIDTIGRRFNLDGTAIRYRLIKMLGEEEYKRRHPKERFVNNNGWNGKTIKYKGHSFQSNAEVEVAKILDKLKIKFKPHARITIGGKIYYPDFYLPQLNIFIEYAGMLDKSFYRRKFSKKISDYSMNNIKCLVVVAETLEMLEATLKELMSYVTKS